MRVRRWGRGMEMWSVRLVMGGAGVNLTNPPSSPSS